MFGDREGHRRTITQRRVQSGRAECERAEYYDSSIKLKQARFASACDANRCVSSSPYSSMAKKL